MKEAKEELMEWELEYDQLRSDTARLCLSKAWARILDSWLCKVNFGDKKTAIKWIKAEDANITFFHGLVWGIMVTIVDKSAKEDCR